MSTTNPTGYRQVRDDLRAKILAGDYAPGSELPSENDLIRATGLNRSTIRRAISALAVEGLIDVQHGYRPRVRLRRLIERDPVAGLLREYRIAAGHEPEPDQAGLFATLTGTPGAVSVPTTYDVVAATDDLAQAFGGETFGVELHDSLLLRTYRHHIDGRPHQIVRSYLRYDMVAGTPAADIDSERPGRGAMWTLVRELGVNLTRVKAWEYVRDASPDDAADLAIGLGVAVRATRRILYSDRRPVEVADVVVPGSDLVTRYDVPLRQAGQV